MNKNSEKIIYFRDLGIQSYQETLSLQEKLMKQLINIKFLNQTISSDQKRKKNSNYLLFVEHPNIFTLGKNGKIENLLVNFSHLKQIKAEFFKTNRGGDITYHGIGQLVVYPILNLEEFKTDIHWYLTNLEEVIIKTLKDYNIYSMRSIGERGVWLDVGKSYARKICALGIRISRWVTMHGFALNVNTDLNYFKYIIPCGIQNKKITSMKIELQEDINLNKVKNKVKHYFQEIFEVNIKEFCDLRI